MADAKTGDLKKNVTDKLNNDECVAVTNIGGKFVDHYYSKFSVGDFKSLMSLYGLQSTLSFQGKEAVGAINIINLLSSITSTNKFSLKPTTMDCQNDGAGGILILCTGDLKTGTMLNKFTQTFHLVKSPTQNNSYFIQNDIFRMN